MGPQEVDEHVERSTRRPAAQEGPRRREASDPSRTGHAGSTRGDGPRPARREHHGVLPTVQRGHPAVHGAGHPGGAHDLRGPDLLVLHQATPGLGAAQASGGAGEGFRRTKPEQGGHAVSEPDPRDRPTEDARPQRHRSRGGDEDHRGDCAEHGNRGHGMNRGKRYAQASSTCDREQQYSPQEAIGFLKQFPEAKFDETVELNFHLGVDPRKADQMIRGTVALPHGTGKSVRVAAFAAGDKAREAKEAGADIVGGEDLVNQVLAGNIDFDAAVATPDVMSLVGRAGRVLGPRGLMPNPKAGTVTPDIGKAVRDIKAGKLEYRVDRQGNLHLVIGKRSFDYERLLENYLTVVDEVIRAKPAAAKGKYIKTLTLASTMGPGIHIDTNRVRDTALESASDRG